MTYVIAFSIVFFIVLILCLAVPLRSSRKVLGSIAAVSVLAALIMYGYGYSCLCDMDNTYELITCILRTIFDSCRILVGSSNWSEMKDVYGEYPLWKLVFWLIHLSAMATSASAMIIFLGSTLLKNIKTFLLVTRNITLIFGVSENTLEFGKALEKTGKTAIVYLDPNDETRLHTAIAQTGAIIRSDAEALNGSVRFLRSIGLRPGKRKLFVYALDRSLLANREFAKKLVTSLESRGILPEQTTLTILSSGEETDNPFQAVSGRYGFGSVLSINEPDMVARILIQNYPPYQSMTFDKNGRAEKDFHGIIIGFGQVGQAVLRQLIMNSQFQGSHSKITIFAPDYRKQMGWISHECAAMLNHYDISLFPYDGRSRQFYDYLEENLSSVDHLTICAGNDAINLEIGEQIQNYLLRMKCRIPILMCTRRGVSRMTADEKLDSHRIYTPDILCPEQIDRMAMVLNQSYKDHGDMWENWKKCSYFNRMSSRAAADFYDALLYCAGMTQEDVLADWDPKGELLENLAATEHLRWNAFHYCMGFRPMTELEFLERCNVYTAEKSIDPHTEYQIRKDVKNRIHACMIPWEDLDAYASKENAVSHENADYAENDRNNIRDLAKVLRAMNEI